jgi:hypothetical protein
MVVFSAMRMSRPAEAAVASSPDRAHAAPTASASVLTSSTWDGSAVESGVATSKALSRVWPWWRWYRTGVSPQFAYRQVVETVPRRGRRTQRFEIRTRYRYVPRRVSRRVAEVDVLITGIDIYRRGRFLGSIERIPPEIRRTRARVFRNRPARIDREIAVMGGDGFGYELIALRPERAWKRPVVLAAARVNVRRGAAIPVRRSSLVHLRGARYLTPIPLLPPKLGRISPELLRYHISYYDDSRFGSIYDGPRWQYDDRYDRYGHFGDWYDDRYDDHFDNRDRFGLRDRLNDRYDDGRFDEDDRFEDEYDRRFDPDDAPVRRPQTVPRPSPGDGREGRAPLRQNASPSRQFAGNQRSAPDRGERTSTRKGESRKLRPGSPSVPRDNARTARSATPATASRSRNDLSPERSARQSVLPSLQSGSAMRTARRANDSARRSAETAGRSAGTRQTPDVVTGRDTRTVGEGDSAVTMKRETKITRLDDYQE